MKDIKIKYPCADGWDSQKYSNAHRGIDIGWLKGYSTNGQTAIYACDDGEVVFEGYYTEVISGKTYKPIGVIIKHDKWGDDKEYYSIYWHLSCTIINKGDRVKMGQKIGNKGNTGYSGGVHLHFQTIALPKGMALPASSQWAKYSFDPTSMIEVWDGQVFKYTGNYNLAKHEEKTDYEAAYNQLCAEHAALKAENAALQASNDKLGTAVDQAVDILKKAK